MELFFRLHKNMQNLGNVQGLFIQMTRSNYHFPVIHNISNPLILTPIDGVGAQSGSPIDKVPLFILMFDTFGICL